MSRQDAARKRRIREGAGFVSAEIAERAARLEGRRSPGVGLSMSHIRTRPVCSAVVYEGGGLVVVNPVCGIQSRVRGRGLRGLVCGFSLQSRRRMLVKLAKVRREALCSALFVTLTYPGEGWAEEPERWKGDLKAFLLRVARLWPGCSALWRMEAQKRGAPHFHVMFFGVGFLPQDWLSVSWSECVYGVDVDDLAAVSLEQARHVCAGTQVALICSERQAVYYVAKYCGKEQEHAYTAGRDGRELVNTGRQWGVFRRVDVPWASPRVIGISGPAVRDDVVRFLADESGYRALERRGVADRVVAFCAVAPEAVRQVIAASEASLQQRFFNELGDFEDVCYFAPLPLRSRQLSLLGEKTEQGFGNRSRGSGDRWRKSRRAAVCSRTWAHEHGL